LLAGVMLIILLTGITAIVAPPNNIDSMTYHMSRVLHWIQNSSVAHYPTHVLRQLAFNPWSEFAITHLYLLSGSDRFVNLVQWMSMIGSLICVSLIAREFGLGRTGQILTVVICATIPMGILQASDARNDYVLAFWIVAFVYFGMRITSKPDWLHFSAASAALGLALLTKGTAYLFAFPFVVFFCILHFKTLGSKYIPVFFVMAMIAASINLGYWTRNYMLFSTPLSSVDYPLFNEEIGPASFSSNVVRNLSLHIATPFETVNRTLTSVIENVHRRFGIDPHDPGSTFTGEHFSIPVFRLLENTSGNFLHLFLILFSGAVLLKKGFRRTPITGYWAATISGFLLFCLFLKWQPWHSRLHLPLFILWSPLIGAVVSEYVLKKSQFIVFAVMTGLLMASAPWVVFNEAKSLVPNPIT
jgi:4-amino-4-deoxy-L-arabinose transferase-like glycosyltransferase